jgi:hypothetical protein
MHLVVSPMAVEMPFSAFQNIGAIDGPSCGCLEIVVPAGSCVLVKATLEACVAPAEIAGKKMVV